MAEFKGKEVELDKPFRLPDGGSKKFGVYVKDGDKVKKVTFGSPDMEIKRDDPKARKSFRARHKCDQQKDKTTASYWSCKMWQSNKSVSDILGEEIMAKYKVLSKDTIIEGRVVPEGTRVKIVESSNVYNIKVIDDYVKNSIDKLSSIFKTFNEKDIKKALVGIVDSIRWTDSSEEAWDLYVSSIDNYKMVDRIDFVKIYADIKDSIFYESTEKTLDKKIKVKENKEGNKRKEKMKENYHTKMILGESDSKTITEKTRVDANARKKALVQFLGYDAEQVADIEDGWDETDFETPDGEYLVLTDIEADVAFEDSMENLWDDIGMDSFTPAFQDWIMENAVYVSPTDDRILRSEEADSWAEEPEPYVEWFDIDKIKEELKDEREVKDLADDMEQSVDEYLNDLNDEEVLEHGRRFLSNFVDFAHEAFESYFESEYNGDWMTYLKDMTGYSVGEIVEQYSFFNVDEKKIFEEVKDQDGRGHTLAGYDGEENEETYDGIEFFIYRTN